MLCLHLANRQIRFLVEFIRHSRHQRWVSSFPNSWDLKYRDFVLVTSSSIILESRTLYSTFLEKIDTLLGFWIWQRRGANTLVSWVSCLQFYWEWPCFFFLFLIIYLVLAALVLCCCAQALEPRHHSCCTQAWLPQGMWDLPGLGTKPVSPALAGGFLTNGPPGSAEHIFLITLEWGFSPWHYWHSGPDDSLLCCPVGCRIFKSIPGLCPYVASRTASFENQLMSADIAIPLRGKIFPGCKLLVYHVLEALPPRRNYPAQRIPRSVQYWGRRSVLGLPRGNHQPQAAMERFKCGWCNQSSEFLKFISF